MKICWDNLNNIRYNKKTGKFYRESGSVIYYKESCKNCGEPFLSTMKYGKFCSRKCVNSGANNPMYGRQHSEETKRKMCDNHYDISGANNPMYGKKGKDNPLYKRKVSIETRIKLSKSLKGIKKSKEWIEKIKESHRIRRENNKYYKIPLFESFGPKLDWCEEVRRSPKDTNILEIRCDYCGKWYIPSKNSVCARLQSLRGTALGEQRFYCSDGCKKACPIYHKTPQTLMKEDAVRAGRLGWLELNREVQPELRQMVLERDEYECQKCGSEGPLHCHHILPVAEEPLLSADIDNCITLCEECHKEVHQIPGCGYGEIRMEVC